MITSAIVTLLLLFLVLGIPVAFSLGIAGAIGLYLLGGFRLLSGIMATTPLSSVTVYEFVTVPMFILMAQFLIKSGVADDMFTAAEKWIGRTPGGLAVATVLTGAAFGAISGSSTASAATLSGATIPAMIKRGYDPSFASAVVSISGTLAMIIPPSIAMVVYGIISSQSISKLLIAGVVPGLLVAAAIVGTCFVMIWRDPSIAPKGRRYSVIEKIAVLRVSAPFVILFIAVTGVIYLGVATPTEAAGLGAFGALVLGAIRGGMTPAVISNAILVSARTSAMIMMIVLGAHVFGYFLTMTQTTQHLVLWVISLDLPRWVFLSAVVVLYIILGCLMDQMAILILTVPLILPVMVTLGYDPIWFGVIVIVLAEIGLVTPPVGLNVFVVARYSQVPMEKIFAGIVPFIVALLLLILVLAIFPSVVLWLPSTMSN